MKERICKNCKHAVMNNSGVYQCIESGVRPEPCWKDYWCPAWELLTHKRHKLAWWRGNDKGKARKHKRDKKRANDVGEEV